MNKNIPSIIISYVLLSFAENVGAVDFAIQPRLEAGIMDYKFQLGSVTEIMNLARPIEAEDGTVIAVQQRDQSFSLSKLEFDDNLPTVTGGVTFFVDRFFIDFSALKAFEGNSTSRWDIGLSRVDTFTPAIPSFPSTSQENSWQLQAKSEFDREEYNISFGYAITDSFGIFAGYRRSDSDFDINRNGPYSLTQVSDLSLEIIPGIGETTSATITATYSDSQRFDYQQKGPFLGAVYNWNIDHNNFLKGALLANVAVAFLDAEVKVDSSPAFFLDAVYTDNITGDRVELGDTPANAAPAFGFDGDTIGFTFGLSWRGLTSIEGLTYSLGVSGYQYQFDPDDKSRNDLRETVMRYQAGLSYTF